MPVIRRSNAVRDAPNAHKRLVDAAIVNVDNHLIRYHNAPIEIDARFGAAHVDPKVIREINRVYSSWTIIRDVTRNGIPVLRFTAGTVFQPVSFAIAGAPISSSAIGE